MVHPARDEAAGSILIEGIAAGLPVLCTEECGFSKYVKAASGLVLPENAPQEELDAMLFNALNHLSEISQRTRDYSKITDFRRRADAAVDVLEEI